VKHDRTFDCEPTLTDTQVIEFLRKGYLMLEGVVPGEVNRLTMDYLVDHRALSPTEIAFKDWFLDNVICNPQATGAVRSLLGREFHLPVLVSNHRREWDTWHLTRKQEWHIDGNYRHTPRLEYLQVFYYPQDTADEIGPTEVLPGSHLHHQQHRMMGHYEHFRHAVKLAAPAGSIFITIYQIWHRGGYAETGVRQNLKYVYWRTTPPMRDWVREEGFDFATADYDLGLPLAGEDFRGGAKTAEMFYWLCGMHDRFVNVGGQSWPMLASNRIGRPYGYPGP
jgi:hypothetical protein